MPKPCVTPEDLFDRPWRAGRRFGPRRGQCRRWGMMLLLLILCLIIFGYGYLTNSDRVREMAQSYLSGLVGGRVEVRTATLSVFEGLRLDGVNVYVDDSDAPDSLLFSAQTFVIKYDPKSMIGGKLEATQIIAQKPHVHLTENVDVGAWNWHRLGKSRPRRRPPSLGASSKPMLLPEILLRNARVEISEIRGRRFKSLGAMAIDGQLSPESGGERFGFNLQSRGVSEVGPFVSGWVHLGTGQVAAKLMNFGFGPDVRSMLPADVRQWWERHELSGRVNIPVLNYTPGRPRTNAGAPAVKPSFRIETDLTDVKLTVRPEEWMSAADVARLNRTRAAAGMVRELYRAAGFRGERSEVGGQRSGGSGVQSLDPGRVQSLEFRTGESSGEPDTDYSQAAASQAAASTAAVASPSPELQTLNSNLSPAPTPADRFAALIEPSPIKLEDVDRKFVFTEDGIDVEGLRASVESNGFRIDGRIHGYRPDAPVSLTIASFDTENTKIPASPRYMSSMPREVREIYEQLRPEGTCRLSVEMKRPSAGARLEVNGRVDVLEGSFVYSRFPYPLRQATGRILFGRDPESGLGRVEIIKLRGRGLENGPNRDTFITVDGKIEPLDSTSGVNIRVSGVNITAEDALRRAFPPEVRQALTIFDAPGNGDYPRFRGSFVCNVVRAVGNKSRWSFDTDITLDDASGVLEAFPYPMRHVAGELKIRDGYADILNLKMDRGDASLLVNGRVGWGRGEERLEVRGQSSGGQNTRAVAAAKLKTDLKVTARNLPIDGDLLAALPPDRRQWLEKLGVSGKVDVDGRVFQAFGPARAAGTTHASRDALSVTSSAAVAASARLSPESGPGGPPMDFDFGITLKDGTLWPADGTFAVSGVNGKMRLGRESLVLTGVTARRGAAALAADGRIDLAGGAPTMRLSATAENLPLDAALYAMLPPAARRSWDEVQPEGTVDARISYDGPVGSARPSPALADASDTAASAPKVLRPNASRGEAPRGVRVVLRPRDLAVTLRSMPYRLDKLAGAVTVLPEKIVLENITGRHGDATVSLSGTGTTTPTAGASADAGNAATAAGPVWDIHLVGENVPVDDEFRRAMPSALANVFESLKLQGKIGFNFSKLVYRPAPDQATAPTPAPPSIRATTDAAGDSDAPALNPEIDLSVAVSLADATLDVGLPLSGVTGKVNLNVSVRDGRLSTFEGDIDAYSLSLAGRPLRNFKAGLLKPAERTELHLQKMRAELAGGTLAGEVGLSFPEEGTSRYAVDLRVLNADVKDLAGDLETDMKGSLTASLLLEGAWGDVSARRGRGELLVTGRGMYRVPLVLGLLQVTNLSLPISGPFSRATARYSVEGEHIAFENIELRADNMLMSGDGHLDFGTKQVRLTFVTDNPRGLKVPFLNELWQGARQELLKIHVRGTVQEPKVSAGMMGTFTTTVDEVFKGDAPPKRKKRRK